MPLNGLNHDAITFTPSAILHLDETPATPRTHSAISGSALVRAVVALAHVAKLALTLQATPALAVNQQSEVRQIYLVVADSMVQFSDWMAKN